MKKWMTFLLAAALLVLPLAGCGAQAPETSVPESSSQAPAPESADPITDPTAGADTTGGTESTTAGTTTAGITTAKPTVKVTTKATTTAKPTTTKPTTAKPTTVKPVVPAKKTDVNVTAIAGPTGVGLVSLMAQQEAGRAQNNYKFSLVGDPTQAVAAITGGTADIAAVPTNLASTLFKKTGGNVQVLAVNTLGVLYMLENGDSVKSVKDLKGKTIYSSGQGANPEYVLKYVLEKNGIDPDKDVKIVFVEDNDALTAAVVTGRAAVVMVPEPKVTACRVQMQSQGKTPATVALNMTEEWEKVSDGASALMMGCVIARKAFVEKNPAAVAAFLKEYEASITAVKSDVNAAAALCEKYGVIPKAAMAKQAIPRCNLVFVTGAAMKKQLAGYLSVLYQYSPASVGGALPADPFYYAG